MTLEIDVSHYLWNAYTKFQIDIFKHEEISPENIMLRNIHRDAYVPYFKDLILETMIATNEFDLLLMVKWVNIFQTALWKCVSH